MNKRAYLFLVTILLSLACLPAKLLAQSGSEPRVWLTAESAASAGQAVTLELRVENAPVIYGIENHIRFDPAALEFLSIEHGDFLTDKPDEETFILQNRGNNETGQIDYSLALLNPAPPVQGDGLVARITFRALAAGPTTLVMDKVLFGTQAGETIAPQIANLELDVSVEGSAGEASSAQLAAAGSAEAAALGELAVADPALAAAGAAGDFAFGLSAVELAVTVGVLLLIVILITATWFFLSNRRRTRTI